MPVRFTLGPAQFDHMINSVSATSLIVELSLLLCMYLINVWDKILRACDCLVFSATSYPMILASLMVLSISQAPPGAVKRQCPVLLSFLHLQK